MKLYIAGGTWEHGRNCFALLEHDEMILIDCGIGESAAALYPMMEDSQINQIKYLFLTHCHKDHMGAYPWLKQHGFHGTIICTSLTWKVLHEDKGPHVLIDLISSPEESIRINRDLALQWGRSGHCEGSVWYSIHWYDKTVLFSGDYCETSFSYPCNLIRNQYADAAVIDCAYGTVPYDELSTGLGFMKLISELYQEYPLILLPVPRYGRGFELCSLLNYLSQKIPVFAEKELLDIWQKEDCGGWTFHAMLPQQIHQLESSCIEKGTIFVTDAQLKRKPAYVLAQKVLQEHGCILFTGHIEPGSPADFIRENKQVKTILYPVHLNLFSCSILHSQNQFKQMILYHYDSDQMKNLQKEEWFIAPGQGSFIDL